MIALVESGTRKRRNMSGVKMAFEVPVSSSRVKKVNPLAVPGCWRTITWPAVRTKRPSLTLRNSFAESTPLRRRPSRK